MIRRRTKILATLGPATAAGAGIENLIGAGVDGVRINCSHGSPKEWRASVTRVRVAAEAASRQVAVVFDLQGPKIRLAADTRKRRVSEGDEVQLVAGAETPRGMVAVNWPGFLGAVNPGRSELIVGDGAPRFDILEVTGRGDARRVRARCTVPGRLMPSRGIVVTNSRAKRRSPITPQDRAALKVAAECDAEFVALSYVCAAEDVEQLRELIDKLGMSARIIAKIETREACDALSGIVRAADAVMVARGDLGVQVGVAQVPALQRSIVRACREQGKLAIMATQMLESMVEGSGPTRAEATDIATAVVQGASVLMLSAETAVGRDPVAAVRAMHEITLAADSVEVPSAPHADGGSEHESVMRAAALLGMDVDAAAYVVPTSAGHSVRALARHRPAAPIVALAHSETVARQLSLQWGVIPTTLAPSATIEETIERAIERARELTDLAPGARIVITSGTSVNTPRGSRLIALRHVPGARRTSQSGPSVSIRF
jgi:pyruvate kinase